MININSIFEAIDLFYKMAIGAIDKLKSLNIGEDIVAYTERLPTELQSIVVGNVVRNKNITLPELEQIINNRIKGRKSNEEAAKLKAYEESELDILKKMYPHITSFDRFGQKAKYVNWLFSRYGNNPTVEETHPIDDAMPTLESYAERESSISQKYAQIPEFKEDIDGVFPPSDRNWNSPGDVFSMSIDDMVLILSLSSKKKDTVEGLELSVRPAERKKRAEDADRVGKVGQWNLYLPTSRANSIEIAGYNPTTMKPHTTWCTARIEGSNLFYNYIGKPGQSAILFYIIKDDPSEDNDWLSLGFINKTPYLRGQDGGISVNRANKGLGEENLKSILGGNFHSILKILQDKCNSLNGVSPAYAEVEKATKNVEELKKIIKGNSEEEVKDFLINIAKHECSDDVLVFISERAGEDPWGDVFGELLLRHTDRPLNKLPEAAIVNILNSAMKFKNYSFVRNVVIRSECPEYLIKRVAKDPDVPDGVKSDIIARKDCPEDIIQYLTDNGGDQSKASLVARLFSDGSPLSKSSESKLMYLAETGGQDTHFALLSDPNCPLHILKYVAMSGRGTEGMIADIINKGVFTHSELLNLAEHGEPGFKYALANYNGDMPARTKDILEKLFQHSGGSYDILSGLIQRSECDAHMLENIARIDDTLFNTICFKLFRGVAGVCNTDTPSQDEALKKQFAQDKEKSISNLLLYLAQNINSQNTRAWKFGSPGVEYVSLSAFQYLANNEKSDEKVLLCLSKYLAGNYYKNLVEALENETASTGRSLSNLLGLFGCREFMLESLRKYPSNSNDGNYDSIELNDRAFNDFILNQMQMAKTPILENPNCTDAVRESLKLVKSASKINMITKLANKYYGSLA